MKTEAISSLCLLFLRHSVYAKKISPHTLRAYAKDLKDAFDLKKGWEEAAGLKARPWKNPPAGSLRDKKSLELAVRASAEKSFLKWKKLAPSSKSRKLAAVRSFVRWLGENSYIEEDFRHLFKPPKKSEKIPRFLSVDEIIAVMAAIKARGGGSRRRAGQRAGQRAEANHARALFFLLYGGGLRVSEACHLKANAINWEGRVLKIKGKGGKERLAALPRRAFRHLEPLRGNGPYLFGAAPLPARKAYAMIRRLGREAGLMKPLNPHALRHSFATHLLLGGSDLRVLQELLGHKTLAATQKYTHLDLAQLSETIENHHPFYHSARRQARAQKASAARESAPA